MLAASTVCVLVMDWQQQQVMMQHSEYGLWISGGWWGTHVVTVTGVHDTVTMFELCNRVFSWQLLVILIWCCDRCRNYLLEAVHESPVTSACLTAAGLAVSAGCEDGVLGLMDVVSRRYTTLMRSHCGPVTCVVPHNDR